MKSNVGELLKRLHGVEESESRWRRAALDALADASRSNAVAWVMGLVAVIMTVATFTVGC